jgi:hypothetical protein
MPYALLIRLPKISALRGEIAALRGWMLRERDARRA